MINRFTDVTSRAITSDTIETVVAADVEPENVEWLINGLLAVGKLQILAGVPGCGKTALAMTLAAYVTRGGQAHV